VDAVQLTGKECGVGVETVSTFHDEVEGAKRGTNLIHIFSAEEMKVIHLGDLGCELTGEQIAALANPDVLLIPVGGFYTIDAKQARAIIDQLNPRVVIPMHYKGQGFGFDVIASVDDFLSLWEGTVKVLEGNTAEVTADTPAQVILPQFVPTGL
jgi:L-ascorbate metabolism protein UlaG (beta-lactamase superfamily)